MDPPNSNPSTIGFRCPWTIPSDLPDVDDLPDEFHQHGFPTYFTDANPVHRTAKYGSRHIHNYLEHILADPPYSLDDQSGDNEIKDDRCADGRHGSTSDPGPSGPRRRYYEDHENSLRGTKDSVTIKDDDDDVPAIDEDDSNPDTSEEPSLSSFWETEDHQTIINLTPAQRAQLNALKALLINLGRAMAYFTAGYWELKESAYGLPEKARFWLGRKLDGLARRYVERLRKERPFRRMVEEDGRMQREGERGQCEEEEGMEEGSMEEQEFKEEEMEENGGEDEIVECLEDMEIEDD